MNMRDLFPGYYQPTEQEFTVLWEECIFSFDTNVLLHIYRYKPETRERFFEILQKLKERIWIPHQVAYEYQKERLNVISQQSGAYDKIEDILDRSLQSLKNELRIYNRHPLINIAQTIETLEKATKKVKSNLNKVKKAHPDLRNYDVLRETLTDILDGKVGNYFTKDKLKTIYKDAEQRFKESIPPGYKDAKKPEPDKYGDAVLWFQLIEHAKSEKKPIIFVTDDTKEDWWLEHEGRTISPRPELAQEMLVEAKVKFYMYSTDGFMKYAENFLKLPEQPESIEEAREIRIQDTESQRVVEQIQQEIDTTSTDYPSIPIMAALGNLAIDDNTIRRFAEIANLLNNDTFARYSPLMFSSRLLATLPKSLPTELLQSIDKEFRNTNENIEELTNVNEELNDKKLPPDD